MLQKLQASELVVSTTYEGHSVRSPFNDSPPASPTFYLLLSTEEAGAPRCVSQDPAPVVTDDLDQHLGSTYNWWVGDDERERAPRIEGEQQAVPCSPTQHRLASPILPTGIDSPEAPSPEPTTYERHSVRSPFNDSPPASPTFYLLPSTEEAGAPRCVSQAPAPVVTDLGTYNWWVGDDERERAPRIEGEQQAVPCSPQHRLTSPILPTGIDSPEAPSPEPKMTRGVAPTPRKKPRGGRQKPQNDEPVEVLLRRAFHICQAQNFLQPRTLSEVQMRAKYNLQETHVKPINEPNEYLQSVDILNVSGVHRVINELVRTGKDNEKCLTGTLNSNATKAIQFHFALKPSLENGERCTWNKAKQWVFGCDKARQSFSRAQKKP